MKKLFLFLSACLLAVSCTEDVPSTSSKQKEIEKPKGMYSVTVNGQKLNVTRGLNDKKDIPGGKVVGTGLYHGDGEFKLQVLPNDGYRIKEFRGGYVKDDGSLLIRKESVTTGSEHGDSYGDKIKSHDWEFNVQLVEACTVKVGTDNNGSVTIDNSSLSEKEYCKGEKCTLTAQPKDGYQFEGWYENGNKISSENPYSFVVSSNRTIKGANRKIQTTPTNSITIYFNSSVTEIEPRHYTSNADEFTMYIEARRPLEKDLHFTVKIMLYAYSSTMRDPYIVETINISMLKNSLSKNIVISQYSRQIDYMFYSQHFEILNVSIPVTLK